MDILYANFHHIFILQIDIMIKIQMRIITQLYWQLVNNIYQNIIKIMNALVLFKISTTWSLMNPLCVSGTVHLKTPMYIQPSAASYFNFILVGLHSFKVH